MKVAVLFSGGKDSCLALHKAKKMGYEVCCLISILPSSYDSFMYHKPNLKLLKKQAEMLGLKLILQKSSSKEEKEVDDLKKLFSKIQDDIQGIVIGGIASNYQGERIKKIAEKFGFEVIAPLWNYSSEKVWKDLFKEKFKIVLTKISCDGLPKEFLGKIIDKKKFNELKKLSEQNKFRIDFEGGEAESAVLMMPGFKREIKIKGKIKSEDKFRHFFEIEKIL